MTYIPNFSRKMNNELVGNIVRSAVATTFFWRIELLFLFRSIDLDKND